MFYVIEVVFHWLIVVEGNLYSFSFHLYQLIVVLIVENILWFVQIVIIVDVNELIHFDNFQFLSERILNRLEF